jgi:hypothetical protein
MASIVAGRRGPSRWSSLAHLAAAAVMVVVLVPLVLKAAQASPPSLAEFAPQVQQTIKKAPPGQNSAFGGAEGGGKGAATPTPTPSPSAAGAAQATPTPLVVPGGARVNKCVGDPPRQIEDPQSPPCVPFWDPAKGNGGSTSFGVDAQYIYVGIPQYTLTNAGDTPTMVNFFNDRFEFYGRKLKVVSIADHGAYTTPENMQADATALETNPQGAFAEITYPEQGGAEEVFYDALAAQPHPVISVQGMILALPAADQAHLAAHAPYMWNYMPTPDIVERNLVDVVCKQLAGKPPSHAGAPTSAKPTRVFGILRGVRAGVPAYDYSILQNGIQACTGTAPVYKEYESSSNNTGTDVATALQAMSFAGVTSIACLCPTEEWEQWVSTGADGQDYYPEWLVSNLGDMDGNESLFLGRQDQASHTIGVRSLNKELPPLDTPYVWAIHYESPSNPKPPYNNRNSAWDDYVYHDLLLLASGIQMAGPKLTPQTFSEALHAVQFPNPGCDGPPSYQACVGFPGESHTMQQSFTEIWYDLRQGNPDINTNQPGAYCYVDRGLRHSLGSWPSVDRLGQYPCT